jgi:hypothetical protein
MPNLALSAPLPALLAPRYRTSGHNSARVRAVYIRTRQPRVPLRQAWNVNTEGNCNRERGLHCGKPGQRWHRSRGEYVRTGEA